MHVIPSALSQKNSILTKAQCASYRFKLSPKSVNNFVESRGKLRANFAFFECAKTMLTAFNTVGLTNLQKVLQRFKIRKFQI
ncbi:hypothetical protein EAW55_12955 [Legionella jordanis]|nr:hypothetical protein EAW55_12955 [Legionella jordanis]RMX15512.1 hypothetical protein EAS68_12120 [Legionella jordanis]